jgi:hypothetical protein
MISRFVLFLAAPSLCAIARADAPPAPVVDEAAALLWQQAPLNPEPASALSQRQFAEHAAREIHLLSELRSWRELLRAGSSARRDLFAPTLGGQKFALTLGTAPPRETGSSTKGLSATWGAFEAGTTLRPRALDHFAASFDEAMTGKSVNSVAPTPAVWWSRARGESKNGAWTLGWSRNERDTGDEEFWSAQGRMKLPANWNASAAWNLAQKERGDHSSWQARVDGPVAHPWGAARAELEWRAVERNNEKSGASFDEETTRASLSQDVKTGALQGQLRANARQIERESQGEIARDAQGAAQAKLQLAPTLSVRAQGELSFVDNRRDADDFVDESQTRGGEVALEWKASRAFSLGVKAQRSQNFALRASDELEREDDHLSLEWKREGRSRWSVALGAREHELSAGETDDLKRLATLRMEAAREILGVQLKTHVDLARPHGTNWSDGETARRVGAQLSFTRAASLDLGFRDGAALPGEWRADTLGAPLGGNFRAGDREFRARFGAGSATKGNGLGLAVEWTNNRREGLDKEAWKVGITYR